MTDRRPADIWDIPSDQHWADFEHKWPTLLRYRYLGRRPPAPDAGVGTDSMPLRHDMRNSTGGIMAAPLCIASPESGGMADPGS